MNLDTIFGGFSKVSTDILDFILKTSIKFGLNEKIATRISPLVYWLILALAVYLTIALLQKLNIIVKIIIFILLGILIIGFFIP